MTQSDVAIYAPFASHLLQVPPRSGSGGAELQVTLLARGLAKTGLRVCQIVYQAEDLPDEVEGVQIVQRAPALVGQGSLQEVQAIWSVLARSNASTVIHRSAGPEIFVTATYCRATRRKFIYSGSSTVDFTGETLRAHKRDWYLHRAGLKLAHTVIAQTDEQAATARDLGLRRIKKISSIADPTEPGSKRESILWIGNSASYKRPAMFAELARLVPEAQFVMVTDDDICRQPAECYQLPNLRLKPILPRDELLGLLDHAVAVVNTSVFEGMPNVCLEAWARGIPALSLSVNPDGLITKHGLGSVANDSIAELATKTRETWQERNDSGQIVAATQNYLKRFHATDVVVPSWLDVLRG